ncbi:MAG: hypothetical protein ACYCVD_13355 [Desulfitobacteriaceae bacterium]
MDLLTIILFAVGLGFLILGWRWQSPRDEDLLTALKGLVHFKHELSRVQEGIQALEKKIAVQDLILRRESILQSQEEYRTPKEETYRTAKVEECRTQSQEGYRAHKGNGADIVGSSDGAGVNELFVQQVSPKWKSESEEYGLTLGLKRGSTEENLSRLIEEESLLLTEQGKTGQRVVTVEPERRSERRAALPEKYLKVLELAKAGLSVREIANHLALSQDAVTLVLHSYPQGGRS